MKLNFEKNVSKRKNNVMVIKGNSIPIKELIQKFLKRLTINAIIVSLICFLLFLLYANLYKNWKLDYIKISNTFFQILGVLLLYLDERYKMGNSKDLGKRIYKYLKQQINIYQSSTLKHDWGYMWGAIKNQNRPECEIEMEIDVRIRNLNETEEIQSNIEVLSDFSNIRVFAYILLGIGFFLQLAVNILEWK